MLGVIVSSVGAAIAGLAVSGFGASPDVVLLAGVLGFAAVLAMVLYTSNRSYRRYGPSIAPRFPTPKGESGVTLAGPHARSPLPPQADWRRPPADRSHPT